MTYDPGIPRPQNDISEDQPRIQTNFQQLNTQFGVNHGAFNASSNAGKHLFATFTNLSSGEIDALEPQTDEIIMYGAEDNAGNAELYTKQYGLTPNQFTKGGIPFIGMKPQAAANFSPGAGLFPRAANIASSWNIASISETANGEFTLTFFNSIKDAAGNATADYYWSIQGFDDSNSPCIGAVRPEAVYSNAVTSTTLKVVFNNQNGDSVTTLTRGNVIIWSIQ